MKNDKCPWWFITIVIIAASPVVLFPMMLTGTRQDSDRLFVWLFPAYVVIAGLCACLSYSQRPWVAWVLVVLMFLTDAAMWLLTNNC